MFKAIRSVAFSLFVVGVSVVFYHVQSTYFATTPCSEDPPIHHGAKSWDACHVFSTSYQDARQKFLSATKKYTNELYSYPIVATSAVDGDGDDDISLTMDIAVIRGDLPGTLVHSSGTHGVEGYAGSAIQLALLEDGMLPTDASQRPTLIFVHAVNPFGMHHYRRFNEHNVDLNRNAIFEFDKFLQERLPNVAGYEDFRDWVAPDRAPTINEQGWGWFQNAVPLLWKHGYTKLKRVLVAGQYHHPQGLFFGGTSLQLSLVKILEFVEFLQVFAGKGGGKLVWIDVHTGLGPFGQDTLALESNGNLTLDELHELFPTAHSIITPHTTDKQAMSGYDLTQGTVLSMLQTLGRPADLFVTQEFGTLPGILVGRALILENALYHHTTRKGECEQCQQWIQSAFYPQSTKWRALIVHRGVSLFLQSMEHASQP